MSLVEISTTSVDLGPPLDPKEIGKDMNILIFVSG